MAASPTGHDPLEGISAAGLIATGVSRGRVPAAFEPVVAAAVDSVVAADERVAVYLYGAVATGCAVVPTSDVDLLTLDLAASVGAEIASALSQQFSAICRAVEVAPAHTAVLTAATDESYGLRLFLKHYCVHLAGPPHVDPVDGYAPDRRAARGLNGDIGVHAARWRAALEAGEDASVVGRRLARKTLLAVGGLVSMHDRCWTTDRTFAARRWAQIDPARAPGLAALATWMHDATAATRDDVLAALEHTVDPIIDAFSRTIGLWG
jgi:hypothetical protein